MWTSIWKVVSFGERGVAALSVYLGLGLMLAALDLVSTPVVAGCDPYTICPPGYYCCHGNCVPENYVCCEDGSSGPGETCACCTGCYESTCVERSTVVYVDGSEHGEW